MLTLNLYAIIILVTLVGSFLLDLFSTLLNLRTLREPLPAEFDGVYSDEAYRKSQIYTRTKSKFGLFHSAIDLIATLAFWFAGGFNAVDRLARGWGMHEIFTGLCYVGIIVALRMVLSLPFSVYSTFVIEERFGFNKTTAKTFILDMLKGLALGVVLGGGVLAGVLAFFNYAGSLAWLYCWIGVTVFSLIVQFVAPT